MVSLSKCFIVCSHDQSEITVFIVYLFPFACALSYTRQWQCSLNAVSQMGSTFIFNYRIPSAKASCIFKIFLNTVSNCIVCVKLKLFSKSVFIVVLYLIKIAWSSYSMHQPKHDSYYHFISIFLHFPLKTFKIFLIIL